MNLSSELAEKWCAALRSGAYDQGTGCLRPTDETYCCLGVLFCLIEGYPPRVDGPGWLSGLEGLDERDQADLVAMNDGANQSFSQIADYIEQNNGKVALGNDD